MANRPIPLAKSKDGAIADWSSATDWIASAMASKPGKCHIRLAKASDLPELERIFLAHEGVRIPPGYFSEFQEFLRNPDILYFVAMVGEKVIGGGGIVGYLPEQQATLAFGLVDPEECCKGYGTALLLARLLFVNPGERGCRILLSATFWSNPFFSRVGFKWYANEVDDAGNRFLHGSHMVQAVDQEEFRKRLEDHGVTLGFKLDRPATSSQS
jgi:hypothetical protein